MTLKAPEYILTEEFRYAMGIADAKVLKAGSFINPIDPIWLPGHIKDSDDFKRADLTKVSYCYTKYGILPIPKGIIRKLS